MDSAAMAGKLIVASAKLARPAGIWSHAVRVPPGRGLLFLSGLTAKDGHGTVAAPDIKGQTRQVLENMRALLAEAGASLADVVKVTIFIRDMKDFAQIHEVRREYFPQDPPASTMVEVSRLVHDDLKIEIEAVALLPD